MTNLFEIDKEYSKKDIVNILRNNNVDKVVMYYNVFGWSVYYTINPTFATPNGTNGNFPRSIIFHSTTPI